MVTIFTWRPNKKGMNNQIEEQIVRENKLTKVYETGISAWAYQGESVSHLRPCILALRWFMICLALRAFA